jgi:hypothetical protein
MVLRENLNCSGRSTYNPELDQLNVSLGHEVRAFETPITTLQTICAEYAEPEIDFLKVDVEGFEAEAFRGNDWKRFRPKVVVAEDNFSENWHGYLVAQDYTQTLHDGLNRFYVRSDLLPEIDARLNRPAVIAIDQYDPWLYVKQLREMSARLEHLGRTS